MRISETPSPTGSQSPKFPRVALRKRAKTLAFELEALQRAENPRLQQLDSVLLYNFICVLLVIIGIGLLGLTIYHAWVLATNSF